MRPFHALIISLTVAAGPALAAPADVIGVVLTEEPGGTFRADVTVRSDDTGWEKYADRWEVLAPDGTFLGLRELAHPHEDEQPFTRSQSGIAIPDGLAQVRVRAHDKVEGWGGAEMIVPVPGR